MRFRFRSALAIAGTLLFVGVVLLPVFGQLPGPLLRVCLSRKAHMAGAFMMYTDDWSGVAVPAKRFVNDPMMPPDMLAMGLLTPYYRGYYLYLRCPADFNSVDRVLSLDSNGNPPANYDQMVYDFTMRTDVGYNFQYFAPMACVASGACWSHGIQTGHVRRPYTTLMFLDSIWDRGVAGLARGGGRWIVEPPAIRLPDGTSTLPLPKDTASFQSFGGWNPSKPLAANVYGSVYPWHKIPPTSRVGVIFADGHAAALTLKEIVAGCTLKDNWGGVITDIEKYRWSTVN